MVKRNVGVVEIAREFQVNVGTVSRALNGKGGVGPDLRARIMKRARELNYQPNMFARALLSKRTHIIGILGGTGPRSFFDNPFWVRVLGGIEESARATDHDLLISNSSLKGPDGLTGMPTFISQKKVDGIITLNAIPEKVLEATIQATIPCVQIDFQGSPIYPSVITDHFNGMYIATRHLISLGHRQLVFIGDPASHTNFRQRRDGFLHAVKESGVLGHELNEDEIRQFHSGWEGYRTMLLSLLRRLPDATAYAFQNDEAAIAANSVLLSEGIKIPRDKSLVGFDDIDQAQSTYPPLTTMRVEKHEMGRIAFEILLESIKQSVPNPIPEVRKLNATLIVRGTTAPPAH